MTKGNCDPALLMLLRELKLPGFVAHVSEITRQAEKGGWGFDQYLRELADLELRERRERRIQRYLKESSLPEEKSLETLDLARFSLKIRRQIPRLCQGDFLDRAENVLVFGLPGRGKTHLLSAIARELVLRERRVLSIPAFKLIQRLLLARKELRLERELRRLDRFEAVLLDDLGYLEQSREEMEVLFTFLAERYERRSVLITSNLVFSQWDRIFKDSMTTAAAIDRLVHHSIIMELSGTSYRSEAAGKRRTRRAKKNPQKEDAGQESTSTGNEEEGRTRRAKQDPQKKENTGQESASTGNEEEGGEQS